MLYRPRQTPRQTVDCSLNAEQAQLSGNAQTRLRCRNWLSRTACLPASPPTMLCCLRAWVTLSQSFKPERLAKSIKGRPTSWLLSALNRAAISMSHPDTRSLYGSADLQRLRFRSYIKIASFSHRVSLHTRMSMELLGSVQVIAARLSRLACFSRDSGGWAKSPLI